MYIPFVAEEEFQGWWDEYVRVPSALEPVSEEQLSHMAQFCRQRGHQWCAFGYPAQECREQPDAAFVALRVGSDTPGLGPGIYRPLRGSQAVRRVAVREQHRFALAEFAHKLTGEC